MTDFVDRIDGYGRPAWIGLMVVSFILFWPLGLAILAFLIGSGRMGCSGRSGMWGGEHQRDRFERKMERMRERFGFWGGGESSNPFPPSGNRAFDEYRTETLRRLEDEAREFRSFLERLRLAKDKAEFDQFMADRRARPSPSGNDGPPSQEPTRG